MKKYYLDTCIWRDYYENRFSKKGCPLGKYAYDLIIKILKNKDVILYSEYIIRELEADYNKFKINQMLNFLFISNTLKKVNMSEEEYKEAKIIGNSRNVPIGDAFHAILARNNDAVLISQDKDFEKLRDIVKFKKPQEI